MWGLASNLKVPCFQSPHHRYLHVLFVFHRYLQKCVFVVLGTKKFWKIGKVPNKVSALFPFCVLAYGQSTLFPFSATTMQISYSSENKKNYFHFFSFFVTLSLLAFQIWKRVFLQQFCLMPYLLLLPPLPSLFSISLIKRPLPKFCTKIKGGSGRPFYEKISRSKVRKLILNFWPSISHSWQKHLLKLRYFMLRNIVFNR